MRIIYRAVTVHNESERICVQKKDRGKVNTGDLQLGNWLRTGAILPPGICSRDMGTSKRSCTLL